MEECLVGRELLPCIDRAAACCDREHEKKPGKGGPKAVAPFARPCRSPHDLVKSEAKESRHHLLLGNLLAVALRARVGCNRFFAPSVIRPSAPNLQRNAGGKHSRTGSSGSPATIIGITRSPRPSILNRRTSSLTYLLCAAFGEQMTMRNCEASSAAMVVAVSECPAEKSSRSRKIGRNVFGSGPAGVSRPARSLSMR